MNVINTIDVEGPEDDWGAWADDNTVLEELLQSLYKTNFITTLNGLIVRIDLCAAGVNMIN